MSRTDARTSITLPHDSYEEIKKIAAENNRSMNSEITRAVDFYIEWYHGNHDQSHISDADLNARIKVVVEEMLEEKRRNSKKE